MSEKINKNSNEDDDLLSPVGFDGNSSLYGEQQIMHDYANKDKFPDALLADKVQRFIKILSDPNTLSHHKKEYARLIDHIAFEFSCRDAERAHSLGRMGIELTHLEGAE